MAKPRTAYVCTECGADYSKWQGQCTACNAWNTISEVRGVGGAAKGSRGARWLARECMGKCRGNTTGTVVGLSGTVLILTQKIINSTWRLLI